MYDPAFDFVLDDGKPTLIESIPIIGNTGMVGINLQAVPPNQIIASTLNAFLDLTDTNTSYAIQMADYMIQVSSTTYQFLYLPSANGIGSKQFYISNNSTQLVTVMAQTGDFIDGSPFLKLKGQSHSTFTANSYNDWYLG
jgi:hypothetical protein